MSSRSFARIGISCLDSGVSVHDAIASVRVHGPGHIEFIRTVTGGRYRRLPETGGAGDVFVPAQAAGTFDVLGGLINAGDIISRSGGTDCGTAAGHCLAVFNTGQSAAYDAYQGGNIAAITNASADSLSYNSGGPGFATHSPQQRFFVIDSAVSYVCAAGQLRRYASYGLTENAPILAAGGGELVVDRVENCTFTYTAGTASRRGLVSLRLDLEEEGEHVFLIVQVQVLNTP